MRERVGMTHALPDCIGITRPDETVSEYEFLEQHSADLIGYPAPDGWTTSRWRDESGAMFVLSKHADGYYNGSGHYDGSATARLTDFEWLTDTVYVTASVVDDEHEVRTRMCAAVGQFPYVGELDDGAAHDAVITGLAREITVYETLEAFSSSRDGDWGELGQPVDLPDGLTMERLHVAPDHFIPTGLFGGVSPMASFSGIVEEAFSYTVAAIRAEVHVARIIAIGVLPIYVCWPAYLAPVPAIGSVLKADAYLTVFVPDLWRRRV